MISEVEKLIAKAKKQARDGDQEDAMLLANDLVARYGDEGEVWALRAYIHRLYGQYAKSVTDLTRALEINAAELEKSASDVGGLIRIDLLFNRGARAVPEYLKEVRVQYQFTFAGYVVMPEHFHVLISEPTIGSPPLAMQVSQTAGFTP